MIEMRSQEIQELTIRRPMRQDGWQWEYCGGIFLLKSNKPHHTSSIHKEVWGLEGEVTSAWELGGNSRCRWICKVTSMGHASFSFHGWASGAPSVAAEAEPRSSCQSTSGHTIKELGLDLYILYDCNFNLGLEMFSYQLSLSRPP